MSSDLRVGRQELTTSTSEARGGVLRFAQLLRNTFVLRHWKRPLKWAFYTDEDLKWDNPPSADCLSIHLSVTLPLNL